VAAASNAAASQARARPGHNTPLVVARLNLGTAEELATRVADLAEVNGCDKLGALDDYGRQAAGEGRLLIFCAARRAPDNATQFVKWLDSGLPKDALARLRYAVFGCGNSDWAATYQSVPHVIDEQLAAHGARSLYGRGGAMPAASRRPVRKMVRGGSTRGDEGTGPIRKLRPQRRRPPLCSIEPVAPSAVNVLVSQGGVRR
jgi:cytochrome P450/NADPH-cytochrome P450 reductase